MTHHFRFRPILVIAFLSLWCIGSRFACSQTEGRRTGEHSPAGPLETDDALDSFKLHPDFKIELVASEPLVKDPVAMAFDERGSLFVVEYPEFNHYQMPRANLRTGRVRRLIDTDNDGRFDQATTFVEVPFATAVICYRGGVFVGAPPDILYCRDTDEDGVADDKRVVLTGFGRDFAGGGLLNSFRWGIDNRIHMATGFAGGRIRRPDEDATGAVEIRGRGVILDPRTLEFELTSGGGQHGLGMDDQGRKFLCSNVYPLQMLVYDDRYTVRNPFFAPRPAIRDINAAGPLARLNRISDLEPWRVARSKLAAAANRENDEQARAGGVFTSASGITVYRGDAFPDEFYGNLFVGEVANNLVYRARRKSKGLEQTAVRADATTEFLASRDNWFRPVQFANGPDGALYVVDMYRQLIEGAAFIPRDSLEKLAPANGTDRGRIYRIAPRGFRRQPRPRLDRLKVEALVELLENPNGWHRDTAARLIVERREPDTAELLIKLARESGSTQARLLALSALQTLGVIDDGLLRSALEDVSPQVRQRAIRLAESTSAEPSRLLEDLLERASDPNLQVRFQLAFTLGEFHGPGRNAVLAQLAKDDADSAWMLMAVQSSVASEAGDLFARLASDRAYVARAPNRQLLASLATQIGLQGEPVEVAAFLKSLPVLEAADAEFAQAIQRSMFARVRREQLLHLAGNASTQEMFEQLITQARRGVLDTGQPVDRRIESVHTLRLAEFDRELQQAFSILLEQGQPVPVQQAVCEVLAHFDHSRVADLLLDPWSQLTPGVRRYAIATLLSRRSSTIRLLDAIEAGTVSPHDLDRSRIQRILSGADDRIQTRLRNLIPMDVRTSRVSVVEAWRSTLSMSGNADRGRKVYERVCAACHRHGGLGKDIGPPLHDTARRPAEALLIDILDPGRQLKPLYQSYVVQTSDGRVLTGMIQKETQNAITLRRSDGTAVELLRIQIESLRSTGVSFMPEGIEKQIDEQAMADLLSYLTKP